MKISTYISEINPLEKGWNLFNRDTGDETLLCLAYENGTIQPDDNGNLIQYLIPKIKGHGIKGSFSFNHGLSEFPYHTDTAFWSNPAQLILMASENSSECDTLLVDTKGLIDNLTSDQLATLYNAVFTLRTPSEIKFVSVLYQDNKKSIFRFDPNIMNPFNTSAKIANEIISSFIYKAEPIIIKWTGENILIVDNWRFLHKRIDCSNEPQRILKRIYINQ